MLEWLYSCKHPFEKVEEQERRSRIACRHSRIHGRSFELQNQDEAVLVPHMECYACVTRMECHARIYAMADKYGIHGLKELARANFVAAWDPRAGNLYCYPPPAFLKVIEIVYTTTPSTDQGLREGIGAIIFQNRGRFRHHKGFRGLVNRDLRMGNSQWTWSMRWWSVLILYFTPRLLKVSLLMARVLPTKTA